MEDKIINEILNLYDEYLDTLRHISGFNLDVDKINRINGFSSVQETDKYLGRGISDAHSELIDEFIRNMLGTIDFNEVSNLRTYIYYPDFKIKTYINNPANVYTKNFSLEKAVIISPVYELNLVRGSYRTRTEVLRMKRLSVSPKVDVLSCKKESIDSYAFKCLERDLINRFKKKFGSTPNSDDLILLRNIAIKYILENLKGRQDIGNEVLYQEDAIVSYDYDKTKKSISDEYSINYNDTYKSKSNVTTPWIYRGLVNFDNREIFSHQDNSVIPLSYMRKRQ